MKSRPITNDEARAFDPAAIVIAWCGVPFTKYRPAVVRRRIAWKGMTALDHDRIFAVPEAFLGRPGPRLVHGVRALRRIVASCRDAYAAVPHDV